jgi:hypothetical protein
LFTGSPIFYYTGQASSATINANFQNKSNNIVVFGDLAGANIAQFIFTTKDSLSVRSNTVVELTPQTGPNVRSEVINVDYANNQVTLKDSVWLTYPNVALVRANSGTNTINIQSLTGAFDIINNGIYRTNNPLRDIIFNGDTIKLNNDTIKVANVNYANGIITLVSNLTANANNTLLSVNRTFTTRAVKIFGPVGIQFYPELTTEDGQSLITEDGQLILLG